MTGSTSAAATDADRPRLLVVTGESSGDAHAAGVIEHARRLVPHLNVSAVGGRHLAAAGAEVLHDHRELSVVGISEVLARLPALRRVFRDLRQRIESGRPDMLLLVDFPDFNLRLARVARRAGVPVVYFISPQVWAWRPGRVKQIRRLVDRMLVLFPFEESFYREHGVPVTYVGHPLVERIGEPGDCARARRALGLPFDAPVIGLLPGSRPGEVERHLPVMLSTAERVLAAEPGATFLVPVADGLDSGVIEEPCARSGLPVVALQGAFHEMMDTFDAALSASGTVTLELALRRIPLVVVYRFSWLTYMVARMAVRIENVSLVNLVAGRRLVAELIQGDFTPERAARELLDVVRPGPRREEVVAGLDEVRERLGGPGAYRHAAETLVAELNRSRTT